jgi:cytochrome c5
MPHGAAGFQCRFPVIVQSVQELNVRMLSLGFKSRAAKLGLLILSIGVAGSLWAQSARDQQIAERLAPVGTVCLAGETCATGAATAAAPVAATGAAAAFDVSAAYEQYCAMCHNTGMAGAPMRTPVDHWQARLADVGINTIVTNAINGINAMPARGMCMNCSDENIGELVNYLMGDAAP